MVKRKYISLILIMLSLFLVIFGINRGELSDILRKATLICLECIGIG